MIHISALSGGRKINHPREVVKEGETVEVRIDQVDPDQRRISLSLAEAVRAEAEEAKTDEEVREYISQNVRRRFGRDGNPGRSSREEVAETISFPECER